MTFADFFKPHEFDSPDAPGSGVGMDAEFVRRLDAARKLAGIPFVISSGIRTEVHNALLNYSVGGSAHVSGKAADIAVADSRSRFIILKAVLDAGFTRIGLMRNAIHADSDETKPQNVAWPYPCPHCGR